ncbi:MAG: hypothetical protein JWN40_2696 [Phycisphaerales bacterium]|nr:hypothetical protein [Phycisphaerales bacterium]
MPLTPDYSRPHPTFRNRSTPRRLIIASLLIALAIAAWQLIPSFRAYATTITARNRALARCLNYQPDDATKPIFDESVNVFPISCTPSGSTQPLYRTNRRDPPIPIRVDNARWPAFAFNSAWVADLERAEDKLYKNRVRCAWGMRPPPINVASRPGAAGLFSAYATLVFLHRLNSPAGHTRLVELHFDAPAFIWGMQTPFRAKLTTPATLSRLKIHESPIPFIFAPDPSQPLRLFPATPNPADLSRFNLPYTVGDAAHLLEGQLNDDDTITLRAVR